MITGKTRIYVIIADPIAQVRTPEVFNALFQRLHIDAALIPVHVGSEDLEPLISGFRGMRNLGGIIATIPHKTTLAPLCDELEDPARLLGSVNTVRREETGKLIGNIFDGVGFVEGLKSQGYDPSGKKVLLVGAGGAAGAIALGLVEAGVASLTIANRTPAKAKRIVDRISRHYPGFPFSLGHPDPKGHDLIINATSLGMHAHDPLPIDPGRLSPEMMVAEIVMKPENTALLAAAKSRGCSILYGRHMLDEQIRLMADFLKVDKIPD